MLYQMPTASARAYDAIRDMVLTGQLRPGQSISQRKIAQTLSCSPVPVLEAMRRLESEGLFDQQPRRMARVRELVDEDLEGLFLLRSGLETATARLCARRAEPKQLEKLKSLGEQFEAAVGECDPIGSARMDVQLHRFIADCARCGLLAEQLDRLLLIERTTTNAKIDWSDARTYQAVHRAVIQAIVDRDEDSAEYLMSRHIRDAYRLRLERIET